MGPGYGVSAPMNEGNYRPESRMREIRLSGLEGGVAKAIPTPIILSLLPQDASSPPATAGSYGASK